MSDDNKTANPARNADNSRANSGRGQKNQVPKKPKIDPPTHAEVEAMAVHMQAYRKKMNNVLRTCESSKLNWVHYRFDHAYYLAWEREASRAFRKNVLLLWRLNEMKRQAKD